MGPSDKEIFVSRLLDVKGMRKAKHPETFAFYMKQHMTELIEHYEILVRANETKRTVRMLMESANLRKEDL